jgi:TRL-like protein family
MRLLRFARLPLLAAALSACGILYTNVKLPRGYRSASPSDVKASSSDPLVTGRACERSALYLVAWGDSSYAAAVQDALKGRDGILYDVRSDMKADAYVLGLYTRVCTVLTGKVAQP